MGAAADALGLSEKTEGALKAVLSGVTPEQMMQLKLADETFAIKMQEIGFAHIQALEQIAQQDRADARQREIKTGDSVTPRLIACVVIAGFFAILLVMMFRGIPPESKDPALILLGALGSAFAGTISYYFGSTAGSAEKSKLLAKSNLPK